MQVFKAFLRVLRSKFGSAIIYIVLFFLVGVLMTKSASDSNVWEKSKMKLVIEDLDDTPESRALTEYISAGNTIIPVFADEDDLTDAMYYTTVDYAVTIPKGFADRLAAGETEGIFECRHIHASYAAANMQMQLEKYVNTVAAYRAMGKTTQEASKAAVAALSKEAEVSVLKKDAEEQKGENDDLLTFFRYMPYIFLSVIMNTLCPALIAMNKKDFRYRTDCSGIHPHSYMLQIFGASAVYVGGIWAVFSLVGSIINGTMYTGRLWLAVVNALLFALFSAVLAIFVSEFAPSDTVVGILTQVSSLSMCFLCGVFIDQSLLGSGVLAAAQFLPAYWYVRVINMLNGELAFDAGEVALALGIQAGFVTVFILLAILVRRARVTSTVVRKSMA
jgi:ABC-type multidrug transport system, permease component